MSFTLSNSGVSSFALPNDTAWFFFGHSPFGLIEQVRIGWIVTGPGVPNGVVTFISLDTDAAEFDARSATVRVASGSFEAGLGYNFTPNSVPCFVKGTSILTDSGYKAVQSLVSTDRIRTSDDRSVAFKLFVSPVSFTTLDSAPYRIDANAIRKNVPCAPLHLSPTHKIQIRQNVWVTPKDLSTFNAAVTQYGVNEPVTYYHIECPNYLQDNLVAENTVVESYGNSSYTQTFPIYTYSRKIQGYTRITSASYLAMLHKPS